VQGNRVKGRLDSLYLSLLPKWRPIILVLDATLTFRTIRQRILLKQCIMSVSFYREQLSKRFEDWRYFTAIVRSPS